MRMARRHALNAIAAGLWAGYAGTRVDGKSQRAAAISFAFSLYGMRTLPLARALRICADIGYSGVELACMAGWPSDPASLSTTDRADLRAQLSDLSLELPCLMENLRLAVPAQEHRSNLERLQNLTQLAQDLTYEGQPPIIETVLGGKPNEWEKTRDSMAASLADWERIAARAKVTLAIKAHVSGAAHRPEHILWLLQQVNSPWIKAVYDFSHFERQGLPLNVTLRQLLPETVFIHVKDNVTTTDGKLEFVLPGDGPTDYDQYLQLLRTGDYRGAVCVEVSGQVSGKPGYNPIIAAERSYMNLHASFEAAGQRARA